MRVCLIAPGFSASEDDWCIPAVRDLARRLARVHDLWVLALRYPHRTGSYTVLGTQVRALGVGQRTGGHRVMMLARGIGAIAAEHRRAPFDVVHGLWADEAGFLATVSALLLRLPSVVSVMGGELVGLPDIGYGVQLGRTGRLLVRRSLRAASVVTVGSASLESAVCRQRRGRPIRRLPLGVDTDRFCTAGPAAELDGNPRLLHVASLAPVKDQHTLLEAFAAIATRLPGARLHIVGDGPLRTRLEQHTAKLELQGRVAFHGAVPHERLPELYRAAHLLVVSSRFESQGMVVLEAAACGTGTVGTTVGILPELGAGSRSVAIRDPSRLAEELHSVLTTTSAVAALGRAAAEVVHRELTLERCAGRMAALYGEVVDAHGEGSSR